MLSSPGRFAFATFSRMLCNVHLAYYDWVVLKVLASLRSDGATGGGLPAQWFRHPSQVVRRQGLKLRLDLRDNLQAILFFTGTYEPRLLKVLSRALLPGDVVVDIGAHVGVHALAMAKRLEGLGGGTVYAFEPAPDSVCKLRAHARANRLDIRTADFALGDAEDVQPLRGDSTYALTDAGVRSLFAAGPTVALVRVRRFDDWAQEVGLERLDLVKIDAEGAEARILQGMRESILRLRPRLISLELRSDHLIRAESGVDELMKLVAGMGYRAKVWDLDGNVVFAPCVDPSKDEVLEVRD